LHSLFQLCFPLSCKSLCAAGTMVNVMGLTNTEAALLQQTQENMENSELRNAAAGYVSAWMR
jgi:hypothetical protein